MPNRARSAARQPLAGFAAAKQPTLESGAMGKVTSPPSMERKSTSCSRRNPTADTRVVNWNEMASSIEGLSASSTFSLSRRRRMLLPNTVMELETFRGATLNTTFSARIGRASNYRHARRGERLRRRERIRGVVLRTLDERRRGPLQRGSAAIASGAGERQRRYDKRKRGAPDCAL